MQSNLLIKMHTTEPQHVVWFQLLTFVACHTPLPHGCMNENWIWWRPIHSYKKYLDFPHASAFLDLLSMRTRVLHACPSGPSQKDNSMVPLDFPNVIEPKGSNFDKKVVIFGGLSHSEKCIHWFTAAPFVYGEKSFFGQCVVTLAKYGSDSKGKTMKEFHQCALK